MKNTECPKCRKNNEVKFSKKDKAVGGKNIYCQRCERLLWVSIYYNEAPTVLPNPKLNKEKDKSELSKD